MRILSSFTSLSLRLGTILLSSILPSSSSWAAEFINEDNIHISNIHRIDDDLYGWGNKITIDGLIEGDLNVGGYTISMNGQVRNSANIFAYDFQQTGNVDGTLRAFVNHASINGFVGRSLLAGGGDLNLGQKALVEKEAYLFGNNVTIDGTIKGKTRVFADNVYINGIVGGDLEIQGEHIFVNAPAVIRGNFTYKSKNEVVLDTAGVTIVGTTTWNLPEDDKAKAEKGEEESSAFTSVVVEVSKLFAAFIFGLLILGLGRRYTDEAVNQLRSHFSTVSAVGLLTIIVFGFSCLVVVVTLVFALIGLILISGELAAVGALILALSILMIPISSFTAVSGGILFYSGKIFVAFFVGYLIVRIFKRDTRSISRTQLLLGLVLLALLFALPYVGFLFYLLISIIGAGAIVQGIRRCRHLPNAATTSTTTSPSEPPKL